MRSPWLIPRLFTLVAACTALLGAVSAAQGHFLVGGVALLSAAVLGYVTRGMVGMMRRRQARSRALRALTASRVAGWSPPPPRVSTDPDVALMARILATPDPPKVRLGSAWPVSGWNPGSVDE